MRCPTPSLPASWKVELFTTNLVLGLVISQLAGAYFEKGAYQTWTDVVTFTTMWCLSFIMINVGYEFTIDKSALGDYVFDYGVAMTAAGFPWLFVALWYLLAMGTSMRFDEALLIARFAAPTSAGILFSMLDAAGLKETWVFHKARILAIFDDLDTIILMIPLKIVIVGLKWELSVAISIMFVLLLLAWFKLHKLKIPFSWNWTVLYGFIIAFLCKFIHYSTHHWIDMEAIHIEVLLPAFVLGTLVDTPCARHELNLQRQLSSLKRLSRMSSSTCASLESTDDVRNFSKASCASGNSDKDTILQEASKSFEDVPSAPTIVVVELIGQPPRAAWGKGPLDASPEEPGQSMVRDIVKGSKQSTQSPSSLREVQIRKGSKASTRSKNSNNSSTSRGMTRYGHSRQDLGAPLKEVPEPESEPAIQQEPSESGEEGAPWEDIVQTFMSVVFMLLVGMSMPALFGKNAKDNSGGISAGWLAFHVFAVSVLMVLGKMLPLVCYRDEASIKQRLALCIGMCPRGEVGASIIVISLELGLSGPTIIVSLCALAGNLIMSGIFISMVKALLKDGLESPTSEVSPAPESLEEMVSEPPVAKLMLSPVGKSPTSELSPAPDALAKPDALVVQDFS